MGASWSTVSGRFVRVLEGEREPDEVFDFAHQRPDAWVVEGVDTSPARVVSMGGQVGIRHPEGWTARVPGTILTGRVDFLLSFDPTRQPLRLRELGQTEVNARRVRRFGWDRSDRDLAGELTMDVATGVLHCWQNRDGRTERIEKLTFDDVPLDIEEDDLLVGPADVERVGELRVTLRAGAVVSSWNIDVPGVPAVQGRPPAFGSIDAAIEWGRRHADRVLVDRDGHDGCIEQ